jgi:hypothetical protein
MLKPHGLLAYQHDTVLLHFPSDLPLTQLFARSIRFAYTLYPRSLLMRASMKYYMETMRLPQVELKIPFSASPVCKHVHLY